VKDKERKKANYRRDRERECARERTYVRGRWRGHKDQDILINTQQKCNMKISMNDVRKVNISVRQIVKTVFLIRDI
jgi:hypothetical protein